MCVLTSQIDEVKQRIFIKFSQSHVIWSKAIGKPMAKPTSTAVNKHWAIFSFLFFPHIKKNQSGWKKTANSQSSARIFEVGGTALIAHHYVTNCIFFFGTQMRHHPTGVFWPCLLSLFAFIKAKEWLHFNSIFIQPLHKQMEHKITLLVLLTWHHFHFQVFRSFIRSLVLCSLFHFFSVSFEHFFCVYVCVFVCIWVSCAASCHCFWGFGYPPNNNIWSWFKRSYHKNCDNINFRCVARMPSTYQLTHTHKLTHCHSPPAFTMVLKQYEHIADDGALPSHTHPMPPCVYAYVGFRFLHSSFW